MEPKAQPFLRVIAGSMIYSRICALDNVDFDVYAGEVHALLGENGAGKSTLARVIAGAVPLSSGTLTLAGEVRCFRSPADSLRAGIAMVYQETSLVPTMSVAQNLQLGNERWITRFRSVTSNAREVMKSLNFNVDPLAFVKDLSVAQRQMVEIARAVCFNSRLIIFDEPTASLSPIERQLFFDLVRKLRERSVAIIFITHVLEEALQLSDRITVLRNGKCVKSGPAAGFDRSGLVRLMIGRDVSERFYVDTAAFAATCRRGEKVLSVEDISLGDAVKNMSFSLYSGEVVGIAGLVGSGRTEIAKVVAGMLQRNRRHGGQLYLRGKPVRYRVPAEAILDGIAYITEDRRTDGFFDSMTIDDNIYLGALASPRNRRFMYSRAARKRIAEYWINKLSISALNRKQKVVEYSGGNQQKIVVARSLAQEPDVIFFDEPTHGVDVGAIPQIHQIIRTLSREGKAVVVISSNLPEILSVSDRILVARQGRIVQEFDPATATEEKIMHAAAH